MLKIKDHFLDETVVLHIYDPQYYGDIRVEIYSVGVPKLYDTFTDIDTGIIFKMKGKEVYRNYKTQPLQILVHDFQRILLNESLGIG